MRGATLLMISALLLILYFNPRAPCGARRNHHTDNIAMLGISIHAPHAGRDLQHRRTELRPPNGISIHAPHAGRDN